MIAALLIAPSAALVAACSTPSAPASTTAAPGATAAPVVCADPATLPHPDVTITIEGPTLYLDRAAVLDLGAAPDPAILKRAIDARLDPPRVATLRAPLSTSLAALRPLLAAIAGGGRVHTLVVEAGACPVVVTLVSGPDQGALTLADLVGQCLRPATPSCSLDVRPPGAL